MPRYPAALTQTAAFNNLNQLTNLSGQTLTYDADGNLTSDGQRNYTWDAENRLVGITYPGQPGKQTTFSYDGINRRTAISSTPAGGGGATTTSYMWCGVRICQARNASNATTREYYSEGEFVPGTPDQTYYYGPDQIGSVRRTFASATSASAYDYDPYGNALQATALPTDFGYAGMFYSADSGLYLTRYRAYDSVSARWISRDRIEENGDVAANLYRYVNDNPVTSTDSTGLYTLQFGIAGGGTILGFVVPQGGYGIAIDTHGNFGTYTYTGVGGGIGVQAGAGGSIQFSKAETIYDLSGPFTNTSLHFGAGMGGSLDYFAGSSPNGQVIGGGITFGMSEGASSSLTTTSTQICGADGCMGSPFPFANAGAPTANASPLSPTANCP